MTIMQKQQRKYRTSHYFTNVHYLRPGIKELLNKIRHTTNYTVNTQHFEFWSNGYIFQPLTQAITRPYYNLRVEKLTTTNTNRRILLTNITT
jgi:hypothetical protein